MASGGDFGFFAVIASLACLEITQEIALNTWDARPHLMWIVSFGVGLTVHLTLRTLKKPTKILEGPER